jgi:TetR/AcrR family transcriptional regulator, mexCD-oprJ operon repressor
VRGGSGTRRQAILAGALDVLSAEPTASMQRVAQASGLHRATLYRHFPSRESLEAALLQRALDDAEVAIVGARPAEGPALEALHRVVAAIAEVGDRYRVVSHTPGTDPALRAREEEVGAPLLALLERGVSEGALRDDLPVRWGAEVLVALVLTALRAARAGEQDVPDVASLVCSTFVHGMGAGPAR